MGEGMPSTRRRSGGIVSSGRRGRVVRVEQENGGYVVSGEGVERLALKTDWGNRGRRREVPVRVGEDRGRGALRRAGAEPGDEVRIGETVFDFQ